MAESIQETQSVKDSSSSDVRTRLSTEADALSRADREEKFNRVLASGDISLTAGETWRDAAIHAAPALLTTIPVALTQFHPVARAAAAVTGLFAIPQAPMTHHVEQQAAALKKEFSSELGADKIAAIEQSCQLSNWRKAANYGSNMLPHGAFGAVSLSEFGPWGAVAGGAIGLATGYDQGRLTNVYFEKDCQIGQIKQAYVERK